MLQKYTANSAAKKKSTPGRNYNCSDINAE